MDKKVMAKQFGEAVGVVLLLIIFIVILALLMMSLGPQAPPSQKMICEVVNATTFCHF